MGSENPKTEHSLKAESLFNVNGLVAVVTGGGTGIGLMITRALAANGARRIYIIGRRKERLVSASAEVNQGRDNAIVVPLPGDVTSLHDLLAMEKQVQAEMGYINLLVANAGIMGPRPLKKDDMGLDDVAAYRAHALKTPMAEFTKTYEVNATGVYYTAMAFLDLLDAGNTHPESNTNADTCSQLITTSSIASFSRLPGASLAYNSSKAAVTHMTKMLATSFVPFKIRANVLAPGIFPSELAGGTMNNLVHVAVKGATFEKSVVPAERAGREEDVAGAVLWMASRAGVYLNGSVVVVDGGRLGVLPSTY